jgi:hypothetical protein
MNEFCRVFDRAIKEKHSALLYISNGRTFRTTLKSFKAPEFTPRKIKFGKKNRGENAENLEREIGQAEQELKQKMKDGGEKQDEEKQ